MYPIELRLANKNGYHTPAEAKKFYGRYSRSGMTVHWWGDPKLNPDSAHDNIVNYILGKAVKGTGSVNYVLSNTKITMLVNPDNVAWASQAGNPTTVSCEFSPNLNAEGYKKAGWLINELFNTSNGRYRIAPRLWRHSDWFSTQCPGSLDLNKMLAEANNWATGSYNPKPTPPPKPPAPSKPINQDFTLWKDGGTYVFNKDTSMFDLTNAKDWGSVVVAKAFKKGDQIEIAGSFHNNYLNRDYYITRYSFDHNNATGFNPVDLDVYVPPRPTPKPDPDPEPSQPPTPPTKDQDQDQRITALEKAVAALAKVVQSIVDWIKGFK